MCCNIVEIFHCVFVFWLGQFTCNVGILPNFGICIFENVILFMVTVSIMMPSATLTNGCQFCIQFLAALQLSRKLCDIEGCMDVDFDIFMYLCFTFSLCPHNLGKIVCVCVKFACYSIINLYTGMYLCRCVDNPFECW